MNIVTKYLKCPIDNLDCDCTKCTCFHCDLSKIVDNAYCTSENCFYCIHFSNRLSAKSGILAIRCQYKEGKCAKRIMHRSEKIRDISEGVAPEKNIYYVYSTSTDIIIDEP